jgi:hypothetical protein
MPSSYIATGTIQTASASKSLFPIVHPPTSPISSSSAMMIGNGPMP